MSLSRETALLQEDLAHYCRNGVPVTIPGVHSPERVAVYRGLVFNNIDDQLRLAFPILVTALSASEWDQLVHDFCASHDCPDPQLWRMPYELVRFVSEQHYAQKLNKPYLDDLVMFEWTEIELFMTADLPAPAVREAGRVMDDAIVMNPIFRLNRFQYPVFRIRPAELDAQAGEFFLLSFRHPEQYNVRFLELAPLMVRIVEMLGTESCSGRAVLSQAAEEFGVTDLALLHTQGEQFLQTLLRERAALGFVL